MDLFNKKKLAETRGELKTAEDALAELNKNLTELQKAYADRVSSTKNPYTTAEAQVEEIIKKYNNESEWGCELVQRIINLIAAFTMPNGLQLELAEDFEGEDEGEKELVFIADWLDRNNLNEGGTLKLAQEANIQGRIALTLSWVKSKEPDREGDVLANYRSWIDTKFEVEQTGQSNLVGPYKLNYYLDGDDEDTPRHASDNGFVFLCLNSRLATTEGRPRIGGILHVLEYLSQDLADLRKTNELFGHPIPYGKCENQTEVETVTEGIKKRSWSTGRGFCSTADFKLLSPSSTGLHIEAIVKYVQIISATTGISPHFLGFPEVLSNRSTADAMGEPTEIVAKSEMKLWEAFFEALFDKVIRMRNANITNGVKLREGVVKPKLLSISDRQWQLIKEVWLPVLKENGISLETFLRQIPNLDVEAELERLKESAAERPLPEASGFGGGKEPVEEGDEDTIE